MSTTSPISFRDLEGPDRRRARRLAASAGLHGVYLCNALDAGVAAGALIGCDDPAGGMQALAWFGPRGNLVLLQAPAAAAPHDAGGNPESRDPESRDPESRDPGCGEPRDDAAFVAAIRHKRAPWRIALGPRRVLDQLARVDGRSALVHRDQIYYGCRADQVRRGLMRDDVRPAQRQDTRALVRAALELNDSDLNVAPWRVHRGWLKESVRRRIREGRTFVIGPLGAPSCKLDIGSRGAAGAVIEGVFTVAGERGRGLATGLVATVAAWFGVHHPVVCLHVGADNRPARRTYEAVGMTPRESVGLLLLS